MTVKGAEDVTEPAVAVTVTLVVTGCDVELLEELPPQPEIMPKPAKTTTSSRSNCSRLRFLRPRKQSATAKVAGNSGLKSWRTRTAVAGGVMVRVVVAEDACGKPVVGLGAKLTGFGLKV